MESVTHREMRNRSGEILRSVEAGESLQVSNNRHPAALIVPVGGTVLHTELHCAAGRSPTIILLDAITTVLDVVNLVDVTRGDFLAAGTHTPLRSNDAIHLATALRLGVDVVVTYDDELAQAAAGAGIRVVAPA